MHWYGCNATALEDAIEGASTALPALYRGAMVLGETGCSRVTASCKAGPSTTGSEAERAAFLARLATSARLRAACRAVLFWRAMELADSRGPLSCEASFGVTAPNNSAYDAAGAAFFRAVGGSAVSRACAP